MNDINVFNNKGGVKYITFKPFNKLGINNYFTTRLGGISKKPFKSLNFGLHNGDSYEDVNNNRNLFFKLQDIKMQNVVSSIQTHSTNIKIVNKEMRGMGAKSLDDAIPENDGMITNCTDTFLTAFFADCVPLYIYDEINKVISLLHAGWKGTLGKIALNAINKMKDIYNTKPVDCTVVIGPSIGPCCYEVDKKIIIKFERRGFNLKKIIKYKYGHYFLDLWEANKQIFLELGIPNSKIYISKLCTCCNNNIFFSYRAENGLTGRMAAVLGLKDGN